MEPTTPDHTPDTNPQPRYPQGSADAAASALSPDADAAPAPQPASSNDTLGLGQRTDLRQLAGATEAVRREVGRVLVGQGNLVELLLVALLADGHVLLEGVPGVAKTLTAKLLARTLDVPFGRIQFTPDLMPSDVLGTSVYVPARGAFEFRQGPIFSNIVLIDEINRAPAKTQSALFEVMEERHVTYDGVTYALEAPFLVLATQNPVEQEGTYRLPEAQLDRFLFKVLVPYPTEAEEVLILQGHHSGPGGLPLEDVKPVLSAPQLKELRQQVQKQHVEPRLFEYVAKLVGLTRTHKSLYLGASPRASLALLNGAKALAALRGRDFVTPEDVQQLAAPVLRHRIQLTPERELEGLGPDDVVRQLIQQVEVPR
ncbi:MoxR family ATPase [Hymenobacter gummosus]|uniref:MoxR family ATPase n=1 Tax=Hymenobacter gummosus TaxID=1776032 RepID=A0A3S0JEE8_9BACT|nr:MoxR family ATPase [Hymenobacter gummosus]RTQ50050.1 MoxR family ATPase [Hymenobacter gummosus]